MSEGNPDSWIKIAEKDLASARKLASPPDHQWETAVYHCQQTAEKAVKALLVLHDSEIKFKKHDIGLLLEKLETYQVDLSELELKAESLSHFATMYRYPDSDAEPLTEVVVSQAILDAELFITKAKQLLQESKNDGDGDGSGG
jgi:HEPN domain-containing protein